MNETDNPGSIPVVLFAYARPDHLEQTLASLRENRVPLIYAYSDGARTSDRQGAVDEVRRILRSIDWCEIVLCERTENLGLGLSIRTGVAEVLQKHEALIVIEDDLICAPGTYQYLSAALRQYKNDDRVMSVTGWTHSRVTPKTVSNLPYFDGRAECWVWGAWRRSWQGMDQTALELIDECKRSGIDPARYGDDLVEMAESEVQSNIWAVRFLYLHILNEKLCLRPPYSLVEHIGFDDSATNAKDAGQWTAPPALPLQPPPIPDTWPTPVENKECPKLWQRAVNRPSLPIRILKKAQRIPRKMLSR